MAGHVLPDHNKGNGLHLPQPRLLLLIGGAGALLLMLVTRGRASSAAAPAAADPTTDPGVLGTPSTFADNGGQAASLGDDVTGALGGVSTSLDSFGSGVTAAIGTIGDQIDTLSGRIDTLSQQPATTTTAAPSFSQEVKDVTGALAGLATLQKTLGGGKTSKGSPSGKGKGTASTTSGKGKTTNPNNKGTKYTMPATKPKGKGSPAGKKKN